MVHSRATEKANLPRLSVIVPCRNEERFIRICLDSILSNDYPQDRLEVIVVDGMSSDETWDILTSYAERCSVKLLRNEKQVTPVSLNLGVAASSGQVICRVDAHARIAPDYLRCCVQALLASGAENVGGAMRTLPSNHGILGKSIAVCMSEPFGVGNSDFRTGTAKQPIFTDTVFGGCFRRSLFERIGKFNERLQRSQDIEFNQRILKSGGRILLDPSIRCNYFACSDLRAFAKRNFKDGMWSILPFAHANGMPVRWRHLVPVLCLALVFALAPFSTLFFLPRMMLLVLASAYLAANVWFSANVAFAKRDPAYLPTMPLVFAIRHFPYGLGSLYAVVALLAGFSVRRIRARFSGWRGGQPSLSARSRLLKRSFDLTAAMLSILFLSPLLAAIAIAVKLDSVGPALYRGERAGFRGRPFFIYKFRTMIPEGDKVGGPSTSADDPRLTRLGRWLRRYKLDELPQLLNVLRGDMSFVGPRPEVLSEVSTYSASEKQLLSVSPGITDWASLYFSNEGEILKGSPDPHQTYREKIRPKKVRLGLRYIRQQSFFTDLRILASTVKAIALRSSEPEQLCNRQGQIRSESVLR